MTLYRRTIHRLELRLASRDTNRVVRPFEWGLDWLGIGDARDPKTAVERHVESALAASDEYFQYQRPTDYRLERQMLSFSSPLPTPHRENNTVWARYLPAKGARRAVVLLPQWNADPEGHIGLGRLLNWVGISALRMSLPYHDRRRPAGLQRAEYHVSSNIGRTIHACRQAAVDARACLDWLQDQGYESLGILGSSLGSCIALLVTAHDARIRTAVFNHVSMWFADVVWTGISTRHVRAGIEERLTLTELRRLWSVISPASYLERLEGRDLRSLLVWASHDLSFLPKYSRRVLAHYRRRQLPHRAVCLPCGHYTLGRAPFKYIDGAGAAWFLHRNLAVSKAGGG